MKTIQLSDGTNVPLLGQGTWKFGEGERHEADEIAALRAGVELGMTLIDTAEMYGEGAAEKIVGRAIEGMRDQVFLVTKAYPHHASRRDRSASCRVKASKTLCQSMTGGSSSGG